VLQHYRGVFQKTIGEKKLLPTGIIIIINTFSTIDATSAQSLNYTLVICQHVGDSKVYWTARKNYISTTPHWPIDKINLATFLLQ